MSDDKIITNAIGIYVKHLPTFLKYMSFPILGQVLGIILAFGLSLGFAFLAPTFIGDESLIFSLTLAMTIPGLLIFAKAFWEYLVAYVALNSMAENTCKSGKIYDINAHKQVAEKRIQDFIGLWLWFGLFTIIAIFPPVWLFAAILFVFIVLVFQVFTFEKKLTPFECFKRSFELVKTNFVGTLCLLLLIFAITYILLPKVVEFLCSLIQVMAFLTMLIDPLLSGLPIDNWNTALMALNIQYTISSLEIAKMLTSSVISTLVICYTLPLRSICWTLWYKKLSTDMIKEKSKKKKKAE